MNRRIKVLMVDDEPAACRMFQRTFGQQFDVVTAENSAEGMAMVESKQPDVVLADVMMPIERGDKFLDRVRAQFPTIAVAMVSAYTDIPDLSKYPFISKPYDADTMISFIQSSPLPFELVQAARDPEKDTHEAVKEHTKDMPTEELRRLTTEATNAALAAIKTINSQDK